MSADRVAGRNESVVDTIKRLEAQNELLRDALAQSIPAVDVWHALECRVVGCERCAGVRAGAFPKVVAR